jgi:hypothetical protein
MASDKRKQKKRKVNCMSIKECEETLRRLQSQNATGSKYYSEVFKRYGQMQLKRK